MIKNGNAVQGIHIANNLYHAVDHVHDATRLLTGRGGYEVNFEQAYLDLIVAQEIIQTQISNLLTNDDEWMRKTVGG